MKQILALLVNIAVIGLVVDGLPRSDVVFGPPGFSRDLLVVMWRAIALLSAWMLLAASQSSYDALAPGLFSFQALYKTMAWLLLDPFAANPITITNLAVLPVLLWALIP